jgi:hypothetical protein
VEKVEHSLSQQPYEVQVANPANAGEQAVVVEVAHSLDHRLVASFRPSFSSPVPQCAPVAEWQQCEDLAPC